MTTSHLGFYQEPRRPWSQISDHCCPGWIMTGASRDSGPISPRVCTPEGIQAYADGLVAGITGWAMSRRP